MAKPKRTPSEAVALSKKLGMKSLYKFVLKDRGEKDLLSRFGLVERIRLSTFEAHQHLSPSPLSTALQFTRREDSTTT